jgi:TonB family protein
MRWCWKKAAASLLALAMLAVGGFSQTSTGDEGKRKLKTKTSPVYPELARRMNVSGRVRIEIIITPEGRVRSTRVVGGHPLLVQACQDAVKEWKYLPAAEESTQIVEFDFHGSN